MIKTNYLVAAFFAAETFFSAAAFGAFGAVAFFAEGAFATFGAAALVTLGFPPSCTSNFGVVPLLRSAALRFAPILRCLALRLASVTPVRDAMECSLRGILLKLSPLVVAFALCNVKGLCAATTEDIILAKGEQKEIVINGLKNFSVGNKDIISTKVHRGLLLAKGRKVGFSDLVVWDKNGRRNIQLYVLSKTSFLKTIQLSEALKDLGLTLSLKGPLMVVTGVVLTAADWRYLQHLKVQHKDRVIFQAEASPELRRLMAADVYRDLFGAGITQVACQARFLTLECTYEGSKKRAQELLKALHERWGTKFIQRDSHWARGNLRLKLKLIQIEKLDGQELNFGLSGLKAKPLDLFQHGLKKLIEENQIALGESHIHLSTLAEPETLIRLGKEHIIEVGAQIPYQNISQANGVVMAPIDWRFAGLKITTMLEERDGQLALDYETEFTRPSGNSISGSKEKSSLILRPGETYKLFQIGYQSTGTERQNLPGLKDIPLIRVLFGSRNQSSNYKRIEGYLLVESEP